MLSEKRICSVDFGASGLELGSESFEVGFRASELFKTKLRFDAWGFEG